MGKCPGNNLHPASSYTRTSPTHGNCKQDTVAPNGTTTTPKGTFFFFFSGEGLWDYRRPIFCFELFATVPCPLVSLSRVCGVCLCPGPSSGYVLGYCAAERYRSCCCPAPCLDQSLAELWKRMYYRVACNWLLRPAAQTLRCSAVPAVRQQPEGTSTRHLFLAYILQLTFEVNRVQHVKGQRPAASDHVVPQSGPPKGLRKMRSNYGQGKPGASTAPRSGQ